jgi:hypothetical protein
MNDIPSGALRSEDGHWWWDGSRWQAVAHDAGATSGAIPDGAPRSEDGHWWWDGGRWQSVGGAVAVAGAVGQPGTFSPNLPTGDFSPASEPFPSIPGETAFSLPNSVTATLPEAETVASELLTVGGTELGNGVLASGGASVLSEGTMIGGAITAEGPALLGGTMLAGGTEVVAVAAGTAEVVATAGTAAAGASVLPVIGWIAAAVIVAGTVIYLVTRDEPATAPGAHHGGPAQAPGTRSGPMSTPASVDATTPAVDPVTGEVLYTPAQQDGPAMSTMPRWRGRTDDDDPHPPPRRTPISDSYDKSELEDSEWLREQIPDDDRRREFMWWLRSHPMEEELGREHPHLHPYTDEAQRAVDIWKRENPE